MAEKEYDEASEKTALLPKSFFGDKGLEVGKTCKIRVTHVYEEEAEVEYVSDKSKDRDVKEPPAMDAAIDIMSEEKR